MVTGLFQQHPLWEGSMNALLFAIPVVVASVFSPSARAEDNSIKTKLVTKFLNEATGGGHYFDVTFQRNGTVESKDYFAKDAGKRTTSSVSAHNGSVTASFSGELYGTERDKGTYGIGSL
jgi:hypothetical protein